MGLKHSKLSPRQQDELLKLFIAGATARTTAELVGIHRNSAALHFRKLRELIAAHQEREIRQTFDWRGQARQRRVFRHVRQL